MIVDSIGLLIEDEAVEDEATLALLLPYGLFIPYFSWFPMRSAYIFTLSK